MKNPRPVFAAAALLASALLASVPAGAQRVLSVSDFHRASKSYVGNGVQITGVAYAIRQELKRRGGRDVPYTSFNLYETDAKGRKGKYYVYVSIPTSTLSTPLKEGEGASINGVIQWPYQIGRIDD